MPRRRIPPLTGEARVVVIDSMTYVQQLLIRNDDGFLHNVHSLSNDNPSFNFGQPNKDPGKSRCTLSCQLCT